MTRALKDISWEERKEILLALEVEETRVIRERYNISNQVCSHLRWHFGRVRRGPYHKDILQGAESPIKIQIKALKMQNKNSLQVAEILHLTLEKVNSVWGKLT